MLSLYRTLSLRYLSRRWFRALLIVASIALGVATLVATRALNETMTKAALNAANPMAGVTDLVVSNGETPIAASLGDEIALVPGVKAVRARLFENARLPDLDNKSVLVMGIDIMAELQNADAVHADIKLSPGATLAYLGLRLTRACLSFSARNWRTICRAIWRCSRSRRIPRRRCMKSCRAGYMEATGDAAALGGYVLILDLDSAARILDLARGQVNCLDIVLAPKADRQKVRKAIDAVLAHRAEVRTPEEQNQSLQSVMAGMQTGFSLCGIAALVVGLFLVFNSLSVSVAERRHEIGILLSLGATRNQVRQLFAGEAALLGLAGSLLGIPLGIGLAQLGLTPMQDILKDIFYTLDARQVEVSASLVIVALAVGTLTAVAAALGPAIQASQENPAEAVRRVAKAPTVGRLLLHVCVSLILMALGVLLIFIRKSVPYRIGTYGGLMFVLVGALTASPFLAAFAARLLQPFVRRDPWHRVALGRRQPGSLSGSHRVGDRGTGRRCRPRSANCRHDPQQSPRSAHLGAGVDRLRPDRHFGYAVGAGGQSLPMDMRLAEDIKREFRPQSPAVRTAALLAPLGQVHALAAAGALKLGQAVWGRAALPELEAMLPIRFCKVPYRDTHINLTVAAADDVYRIEKSRLSKGEEVQLYKVIAGQRNAVIASENFAALYGVGPGIRSR